MDRQRHWHRQGRRLGVAGEVRMLGAVEVHMRVVDTNGAEGSFSSSHRGGSCCRSSFRGEHLQSLLLL